MSEGGKPFADRLISEIFLQTQRPRSAAGVSQRIARYKLTVTFSDGDRRLMSIAYRKAAQCDRRPLAQASGEAGQPASASLWCDSTSCMTFENRTRRTVKDDLDLARQRLRLLLNQRARRKGIR